MLNMWSNEFLTQSLVLESKDEIVFIKPNIERNIFMVFKWHFSKMHPLPF